MGRACGGTMDYERVKESVTCTICLGVITNCRTVSTCLHRFCNTCIEPALRVNSKCPQCRANIPSRRSCREDKAFDALVEAIYGDVEQQKAVQRKLSDDWWAKNKGSFKHIGESFRQQAEATKGRRVASIKSKLPKAKKKRGRPAREEAQAAGAGPSGRVAPRPRGGPGIDPKLAAAESVHASYDRLKRDARERSDEVVRKLGDLQRLQREEDEKRQVLITLTPGEDIPQYAMPKPFLLCNPDVKVSSLQRLIASKHPGSLSAERLHMFVRMGTSGSSKLNGEMSVRRLRSADLGDGINVVYSLDSMLFPGCSRIQCRSLPDSMVDPAS